MSAIFRKWTNRDPPMIIIAGVLVGTAVGAGARYYLIPRYCRIGYHPIQPVAFSHATHNGQLGIDCRYCHSAVDKSWYSNVPGSGTCMNCHNQVLKDDPRLQLVRDSAATGKPIPWIQIHRTPDYVYFNHSVHVNRGISCVSCHGQINEMEVVHHDKPHSMGWCLECHRNAETALRPLDQVTNLTYKPEQLSKEAFYAKLGTKPADDSKVLTQEEVGKALKEKWKI